MGRQIKKMGKTPAMPRCVVCDTIGVFHIGLRSGLDVWLCGKQVCKDVYAQAGGSLT